MLFYSFKAECVYREKKNLSRAFGKSRGDGARMMAHVNDNLCGRIEDGRLAFFFGGNPGAWQGVAAFGEKEYVSPKTMQTFLADVMREHGGVSEVSVSGLSEITMRDFRKALSKADDMDYLEDSRRALLNMVPDVFDGCRGFGGAQFKLREEIREGKSLGKAAALARAEEIMADESLLGELERIYSAENVRRFHGHPVHYKITAGSRDAAKEIVYLLTGALRSARRLLSRRITFLSDITEQCYDESDVEELFKQAAGTTVVIDMGGADDEEHGSYASAYERVTDFFAELIKKHGKNVLCVFVERVDRPGFSSSLISKAEEHIDILPVSEGAGDRPAAEAYLRRLVGSADFEVMDDAEIRDALAEKTAFTASDLHQIFGKFRKSGLKNKLYRAYKTVSCLAPKKPKTEGDAYAKLQKMVGLSEVKRIIGQIVAAHKMQKMRTEMGLKKMNSSLHMIFTGNPGSAKTTVARLLADILKKEGVAESGAFVECGRSDLVGKYVGWTAPTVKQKFRQARGGILFIDEAYSLVDDRDGLYGDEAIHTIVQEMENNRESVVVIFAGYPDKMEKFLEKNEGLRSRIAFHVDFPDYDADELTEILALMAEDRGYALAESVRKKCRAIFKNACRKKEFGNGRFARNLLEQAVMKQSERVLQSSDGRPVSREALLSLAPEDFNVNARTQGQEEHVIGFCG